MKKLTIIMFATCLLLSAISFRHQDQVDFNKLGKGKIIETDRSIKKNIMLHEIHFTTEEKPGYIIYIKDGSLHDLLMEKIEHLEFPDCKQGPVKLFFKENKILMLPL